MNKIDKQIVFNKVLFFIRKQGVGSMSLYDKKTQKMCSLGYLYSTINGVDRLRLNKECHIIWPEQEVELFLTYHFKIEHPEELSTNFINSLRMAHDIARRADPDNTNEEIAMKAFEESMKSLADSYNLRYAEPCKILKFLKEERIPVKLHQVA